MGTCMCLTWLPLESSIIWKFTSPLLHEIYSNFTRTYLGVVRISEREITLTDLDIGKLPFSSKSIVYSNEIERDTARAKEHLFWEYDLKWLWPCEKAAISNSMKTCTLLSKWQAVLQITTKHGSLG